MSKAKRFVAWLWRELLELFPVWLFFLSAFALLRLTRSVLLESHGIHVEPAYSLPLGALIVAKAFALAESIRLTHRFRESPLIYGILWRTSIYFLFCLVFQFAEGIVRGLRGGASLGVATAGSIREMTTAQFGVILLWLFLLLAAFATSRELSRALGKERLARLLVERPTRRAA